MLVLTRKDGEAIRIGDDILIKVSQIRGGRVKIAIDAPQDVRIRRSELEARQMPMAPVVGVPSITANASYHSAGVDF